MNSRVWRRELEDLCKEHDLTLDVSNGKHYILRHESGWFVYASRSPSDGRVLQYVKSDIRRKANGTWR